MGWGMLHCGLLRIQKTSSLGKMELKNKGIRKKGQIDEEYTEYRKRLYIDYGLGVNRINA